MGPFFFVATLALAPFHPPALSPRAASPPQLPLLSRPAVSDRSRPLLLAALPPTPATAAAASRDRRADRVLRARLLPICLCVFVQFLGVGVTISTLPLYLLGMGVSTLQLSLVISAFSGAQMLGVPFLVKLSDRIGRSTVILVCMLGAAVANLLTALTPGYYGAATARVLAGLFAAASPVAQAAVADIVPPGPQMTKALGLVAATCSMGVTVGPAFAAVITALLAKCGIVGTALQSRCIFGCSAVLAFIALFVGVASGLWVQPSRAAVAPPVQAPQTQQELEDATSPKVPRVLWDLRLLLGISFVVGCAVTLSVATYTPFAARMLGYGQAEIGWLFSSSSVCALTCNILVLPRLVRILPGAELGVCSLGLLLMGGGLSTCVLVRSWPVHFLAFILRGAGVALADTSVASLIARYSLPERKAINLGLSSSVQAGARLVCPLVAGFLLDLSFRGFGPCPPGTLPFLLLGSVASLASLVPLGLHRLKARSRDNEHTQ